MQTELTLKVTANGEQETASLQSFTTKVANLLTDLEHSGAKMDIGCQNTAEKPAAEPEAPAQEPEAPAEEPVEETRKVTKKTYFHHEPSDEVYILNKGDDYPTDPDVSAISKAKYDELVAAAEAEDEAEPLEGEVVADEPTADLPTQEQVKKALSDVVGKKGATVAKALLEEMEVARLSELDPESYPALMDKIAETLA